MQTTQGAIRGSLWVRKPSVVDEDRTTLVRVASGEESALEDIYARFGPSLFGHLLTLTPDRQLAEEILQDTLLVAVWRSASTYGWLRVADAGESGGGGGLSRAQLGRYEALVLPCPTNRNPTTTAIFPLSVLNRREVLSKTIHAF